MTQFQPSHRILAPSMYTTLLERAVFAENLQSVDYTTT